MNHILPHRGSHPYRIDPTQPYKTFAFEENDAKRMCSLHDSLGGSMMCGKICMYRVKLDINPNCNFFKALYSRYSVAARTAANGNRQPHLFTVTHPTHTNFHRSNNQGIHANEYESKETNHSTAQHSGNAGWDQNEYTLHSKPLQNDVRHSATDLLWWPTNYVDCQLMCLCANDAVMDRRSDVPTDGGW